MFRWYPMQKHPKIRICYQNFPNRLFENLKNMPAWRQNRTFQLILYGKVVHMYNVLIFLQMEERRILIVELSILTCYLLTHLPSACFDIYHLTVDDRSSRYRLLIAIFGWFKSPVCQMLQYMYCVRLS